MLFKQTFVLHQVYDLQLNQHIFLLLYGIFLNTLNPLFGNNIYISFCSQNQTLDIPEFEIFLL